MNDKSESSAENLAREEELASAVTSWKATVKENCFFVLFVSVGLGLLLGYLISQHQEAKKRELWAEIFFRQVKNWLAEHSGKTVIGQGLEYARSAAEKAAHRGVEYTQRVNPFHKESRRRLLGIF